jgi:hypothetical protein
VDARGAGVVEWLQGEDLSRVAVFGQVWFGVRKGRAREEDRRVRDRYIPSFLKNHRTMGSGHRIDESVVHLGENDSIITLDPGPDSDVEWKLPWVWVSGELIRIIEYLSESAQTAAALDRKFAAEKGVRNLASTYPSQNPAQCRLELSLSKRYQNGVVKQPKSIQARAKVAFGLWTTPPSALYFCPRAAATAPWHLDLEAVYYEQMILIFYPKLLELDGSAQLNDQGCKTAHLVDTFNPQPMAYLLLLRPRAEELLSSVFLKALFLSLSYSYAFS